MKFCGARVAKFGTSQPGDEWDPTHQWGIANAVLWGAAALHPSMRNLFELIPYRTPKVRRRRIALLAATSSQLYVGYNNTAGLVIYRSSGTAPASRSDFEGAGGCDASTAPSSCDGLGGRGLGVGATGIFDGRVLTYGSKDYVYLTAGTGTSGFRVFRLVR